jgi:hypothetical protein
MANKKFSKVVCRLTIISEEPYASQKGRRGFTGKDIEELARYVDDFMHIEEISAEEITPEEAEKERTRLENM